MDMVDHCATLDIEASDFYQTGRGIERTYGLMFFACSWELEPKKT